MNPQYVLFLISFWLRHFHSSMYVLSSWKIRIKLTFHWSIGVLLYLYCVIERTLSMWPSFGSGSSCFGVCIDYLRFPDMELEPWDELPNPPTWSRFPATNFCICTLFSCQPSVNTWEFQWSWPPVPTSPVGSLDICTNQLDGCAAQQANLDEIQRVRPAPALMESKVRCNTLAPN